MPVSVAVISFGSQLVGLNWKLGRSIAHAERFDLGGDAFDEGREGVACDRHRGGARIDGDLRADGDVAEVEGAGDCRGDDCDAEGGALVGAGQVDLTGQRDRFGSEAGGGDRVPDQAVWAALVLGCLWFWAGRDRGEHRRDPARQVHAQRAERLVRVRVSDVQRERREGAG